MANWKSWFTKERWGVSSNFEVVMILVVFSLSGSIAVHLAHPATHLIGFDPETTSPWVFWPVRIALIFPIYQIVLVALGTLLGQRKFFWPYGKKMLRRLGMHRLLPQQR